MYGLGIGKPDGLYQVLDYGLLHYLSLVFFMLI